MADGGRIRRLNRWFSQLPQSQMMGLLLILTIGTALPLYALGETLLSGPPSLLRVAMALAIILAVSTPLIWLCAYTIRNLDIARSRYKRVAAELDSRLNALKEVEQDQARLVLLLQRREADLVASEQRFRILADATHEGIALIRGGRIWDANGKLCAMSGYTAENLRDMDPLDLLPNGDRDPIRRRIGASGNGTFDTFLLRVDHRGIPVNLNYREIAHWGEMIGVMSFLDLTDRRRIESLTAANEALKAARIEAEQANAAKSRFLAQMSHELRTPLNAILGFGEMIQMQVVGKIEQEKYLDYARSIVVSGHYLLELINDILDLSKIEAGHEEIAIAPVDLIGLTVVATDLVKPRARKAGIELTNPEAATVLPKALADERAIRQILFNLLSNAIKFTPAGGTIDVQLAEDGPHLVLSVRDTGIGIPPDKLSSITEPFVTGAREHRVSGQGTGLGLAITKRLAELQNGSLEIDSTPGQGTEVRVFLPKVAAE